MGRASALVVGGGLVRLPPFFLVLGVCMTVQQAAYWFLWHGGGAVVIVGTALVGVAAGATAVRWIKGMLFG